MEAVSALSIPNGVSTGHCPGLEQLVGSGLWRRPVWPLLEAWMFNVAILSTFPAARKDSDAISGLWLKLVSRQILLKPDGQKKTRQCYTPLHTAILSKTTDQDGEESHEEHGRLKCYHSFALPWGLRQ